MKINVLALAATKSSSAGFVIACALVAGMGWVTMDTMNQIGAVHDRTAEILKSPSPVYLHYQRFTNPPAQQHRAAPETSLPTNSILVPQHPTLPPG